MNNLMIPLGMIPLIVVQPMNACHDIVAYGDTWRQMEGQDS